MWGPSSCFVCLSWRLAVVHIDLKFRVPIRRTILGFALGRYVRRDSYRLCLKRKRLARRRAAATNRVVPRRLYCDGLTTCVNPMLLMSRNMGVFGGSNEGVLKLVSN